MFAAQARVHAITAFAARTLSAAIPRLPTRMLVLGTRAFSAPLISAAILGLVTGCAKMAPPPGGPEDHDPPVLVHFLPAQDSAGVAPDAPLVFTFSEKMDRRSVLKALRIYPTRDFARADWVEDTLSVQASEPWAAGRRTTVWIGAGARDARGNVLTAPHVSAFTTAAEFDSSTVEGRVALGKESASGGNVLVALVPGAALDSAGVREFEPEALALSDRDGRYRFPGIPAGSYNVIAYLEKNGDALPRERSETWSLSSDRAEVPGSGGKSIIPDFLLGTLDSTGTISGDVFADSGRVFVQAHRDSARADLLASTFRKGSGPFSLSVRTGSSYWLRSFLDANADSALSSGEAEARLSTPLSLELQSSQRGVRFDLRGASEVGGPSSVDSTGAPAAKQERGGKP